MTAVMDRALELPAPKAGVVYIYALCEPGTDEVRYVGKSVNLKRRFNYHLSSARSGKHQDYRGKWVRSVLDRGLEPRLLVLEHSTDESWEHAEQHWISLFIGAGHRLTNGTSGGEYGAVATPETRAKMSAAAKARVPTERQLLGLNGGRGRKGAACPVAKLTEADVLRIRRLKADGWSYNSLAREFGVAVGTIQPIVMGRTWTEIGGIVPRSEWKKAAYPRLSEETKRRMSVARIMRPAVKVKLTDEAVRQIRRRFAEGERQVSLAVEFGVSTPTIHNVVMRRTWRHVQEEKD